MLYEFRKGVTIETALNNIVKVYQDHRPRFSTVWKWFTKNFDMVILFSKITDLHFTFGQRYTQFSEHQSRNFSKRDC